MSSHLLVYDCNYPEIKRYITLNKSGGSYTGWYYNINDSIPVGSEYSGSWISYVNASSYRQVWNERKGAGNVNLLTINTEDAVIRDDEGNIAATLQNGELHTDRNDIYPMILVGTMADGDPSENSSISLWLPSDDIYTISKTVHSAEKFEVSMVNVNQSAAVTTSANQVTLGVDDDQKLSYVELEKESGNTYEIMLDSSLGMGYKEVQLKGFSSKGTVALAQISGRLYADGHATASLTADGAEVPASGIAGSAVQAVGGQNASDIRFEDVGPNEYYSDAVAWAVSEKITSGISTTRFGPNQFCTRGQIVTFLWRAAGEPAPKTNRNPFIDVKPSDYFYTPVMWAVENNITSGTDTFHFSPSRPCTRGQAMTFLWRANGKPVPQIQNHFIDVSSGSYYSSAVSWAVEHDVTSGVSSTHFAPESRCTRGQIVTFLYRSHINAKVPPLESLPDGNYVLTLSKDTMESTRRGTILNSHLVYKICLEQSYVDSLRIGTVIPIQRYGYNNFQVDRIKKEIIQGDPNEYRRIAMRTFIVKGASHMPEYIPLEMRDTELPWQLWVEGENMLDSYFYRSSPVSLAVSPQADFDEVATIDYGASPRRLRSLPSFFSGEYTNKWVNMMVTVKNGQVTYGKIYRGVWDNEPFPLVLK